MYRQPNAEQLVILVNITRLATLLQKHVLMDVRLIIHAINVLLASLLRPAHTLLTKLVVMDVRLTVLAALLAKPANHPAVHQHRQHLLTATATLARADIQHLALTVIAVQLIKNVLAELPAALNVINANRLRQHRPIPGNMSERKVQQSRSAMKTTDKSGKSAKPGIIA